MTAFSGAFSRLGCVELWRIIFKQHGNLVQSNSPKHNRIPPIPRLMLTDAQWAKLYQLMLHSGGLPVHFELSGGQINDVTHAQSLISNSPQAEYIVADKRYDSDAVRAHIEDCGASSVIPRRKTSKKNNDDMDWCLYKYRHLVENAFGRIKNYRAIATRYEKLERNYASMVSLAFSMMWLPMWAD